MARRLLLLLALIIALLFGGIWAYRYFLLPRPPAVMSIPPSTPPVLEPSITPPPTPPITQQSPPPVLKPAAPKYVEKFLKSVEKQTQVTRNYDAEYVRMKYPGGDVPQETGVCADVIVRAFRAEGVDLQKELHEDMASNFGQYPTKWRMKAPDSNIDHRRVYNLMTYFQRRGKSLPVTQIAEDYKPGDIISWDLGGGQGHIGIVTQYKSPESGHYLVGHNIGYGTNIEDVLFSWPIIGHYRYFSAQASASAAPHD